MLSEAPAYIRRVIRFMLLPYCYFRLINWNECTSSRIQVVKDLFYIFFKLKYFPDNYGPCRLWEIDRSKWSLFYGSSYNSYSRSKLRKEVQPYEYQILFNDKAVCELLCKGLDERIPKAYGVIEPSDRYKEKIIDIFDRDNCEKLMIKPVLGHAGRGIVMAVKDENKISVMTGKITIKLHDFILDGKYLLQEFVVQDAVVAKISSSSLNTIRLVTLYTKSGEVLVVSSSMRFGMDAFVDNWSSGGLAVGVKLGNGRLKKIAYDKYGKQYTKHPVSGETFDNFQIPMWDKIMQTATNVQAAFPFYKLLGMDIAVSEKGPVLIEVNANSDLIFQEQTSGPLLKDKRVLSEFGKYNLLINKYQKNLYR